MVLKRSFKKRIIVAGGGYAGVSCIVELTKQLKKNNLTNSVEIMLIDPYEYQQTLSEFDLIAATHRSRNSEFCKLSYADIFNRVPWGSFKKIDSKVVNIFPEKDSVLLEDGRELEYWRLVIATGAEPFYPPVDGLKEYALPVWSVSNIKNIHDRITECYEIAKHSDNPAIRDEQLSLSVIGGGDTGVEVVGTFAAKLPFILGHMGIPTDNLQINLIEAQDNILPHMNDRLRNMATNHLVNVLNVKVHTGKKVNKITENELILEDGSTIPSKITVWAGGIRANSILEDWDLPLDKMHRVETQTTLKSVCNENIYVIGDAAAIPWEEKDQPLLMTAQFAIQEGPHCAQNIVRELKGNKLINLEPHHRGEIVSVGDYCVGLAFGKELTGLPAMFVKRFTYFKYWYQIRGIMFALQRTFKMFKL